MHTLSKSDFKLGCTCPTKLYYKELGYPATGDDDPYLRLLADGGYMVEEIARILHEPEGRALPFHSGTRDAALATTEALAATNATLFEATLLNGIKVARVDILVKRGDAFEIIEVKSKSYDGAAAAGGQPVFRGRNGQIKAEWEEYLLDVAYQVHLLLELHPSATVRAFLMMPDKSKTTGLEDIHRQFTLTRTRRDTDTFDRTEVVFTGDREALRQSNFLSKVEVTDEVNSLLDVVRERAAAFALSLTPAPRKIETPLSLACAKCEYRVGAGVVPSGFAECWGERAHVEHHILDLYKGGTIARGKGVKVLDEFIRDGAASVLDVPKTALVKSDGTPGANNARQLIQIEHTRARTRWVSAGLRSELDKARYPLHFIDFETSALAVPYHAGMRPYEQAAFQWSCHTIERAGAPVAHAEWLNDTDAFPNAEFARSLRARIGDDGTVLIWTKYERSILRTIHAAMINDPDRDEALVEWLASMIAAEGSRLLDMNHLALHHYFDPAMKGRTSIKVVLDAVWKSDEAARHEFPEYAGNADSPYKSLPPVRIAGTEVNVQEGQGAVRAYQEMMYGAGRNDPDARRSYRELLLNYCRLDTAAMVIIWRHWGRQV